MYMFQYFINFISNFTKTPFILSILKETIMGNKVNKTLDYYRNKNICSIFEEDIRIDYKSMGKPFTIKCTSPCYNKALDYIKKNPNPFYVKKILLACELLDNGEFHDITAKVLRLAGPDCDFYEYTDFNLVCSDISDYPVFMITNELLAYKFQQDDKIDFIWTKMVDIKKELS